MANFSTFKPTILRLEGGYQNNPKDTGNYNSLGQNVGTNYGISAKTYENFIGYPPSAQNMRALSQPEAFYIFENWYWNVVKANQINDQAVAEAITDHAINANPYQAVKIAQKTLNTKFGKTLSVDGVMGSNTLSAINTVNNTDFFREYVIARKNYYFSLGNSTFIGGWIQRLRTFSGIWGKNFDTFLKTNKTGIIQVVAFSAIVGLGYFMYQNFKENK